MLRAAHGSITMQRLNQIIRLIKVAATIDTRQDVKMSKSSRKQCYDLSQNWHKRSITIFGMSELFINYAEWGLNYYYYVFVAQNGKGYKESNLCDGCAKARFSCRTDCKSDFTLVAQYIG